jgi:hypothetical protein
MECRKIMPLPKNAVAIECFFPIQADIVVSVSFQFKPTSLSPAIKSFMQTGECFFLIQADDIVVSVSFQFKPTSLSPAIKSFMQTGEYILRTHCQ